MNINLTPTEVTLIWIGVIAVLLFCNAFYFRFTKKRYSEVLPLFTSGIILFLPFSLIILIIILDFIGFGYLIYLLIKLLTKIFKKKRRIVI